MEKKLKRSYPRRYLESPIFYSDEQRDYRAKMYNASQGGMYFETLLPLSPGARIRVKMENSHPDIYYAPEAFMVKRAKVQWCSKIIDDGILGYGVGVEYC